MKGELNAILGLALSQISSLSLSLISISKITVGCNARVSTEKITSTVADSQIKCIKDNICFYKDNGGVFNQIFVTLIHSRYVRQNNNVGNY